VTRGATQEAQGRVVQVIAEPPKKQQPAVLGVLLGGSGLWFWHLFKPHLDQRMQENNGGNADPKVPREREEHLLPDIGVPDLTLDKQHERVRVQRRSDVSQKSPKHTSSFPSATSCTQAVHRELWFCRLAVETL